MDSDPRVIKEETLTGLGTLVVFVMLKTPPGKTWVYMETDPEWWAVRLLTRSDRLCLTHWLSQPAQVVKRCAG